MTINDIIEKNKMLENNIKEMSGALKQLRGPAFMSGIEQDKRLPVIILHEQYVDLLNIYECFKNTEVKLND